MDRIINSKVDKHSIYEIYRSCRLCGAGAGYKMPIIQNVIHIDGEEVELKKKIRECVQIEVHQDDKMPPLICELCVDKVNDFYEFLEMCRQTNKRTRKRLGLPLQTTKKGSSDSSDCILGVTEPVYLNEDSDEPLSRQSPRNAKLKSSKIKKEVKVEINRDSRSTRGGNQARKRPRSPSPRTTRQSRSSNEDNQTLSSLKTQPKKASKPLPPPPKSILKKDSKVDDKLNLRSKRTSEPPKPAVPQKKVKLSVKLPVKGERTRAPPPPPGVRCNICRHQSKTVQANSNHMKIHTVTFTSDKLACNSCREWFATLDDALSHHRRHKARNRPYICRGCRKHYATQYTYQVHTGTGQCVPWKEIPDVKCPECWRMFPTNNWMEQHKCAGVDGRPGGKCSKCSRTYALMKNLKKHESSCNAKKRGEMWIDPVLLSKVKPLQVRVARCDPLLVRVKDEHYDVSELTENYGLDLNCVYPYINSSLNFNRMVNIKTELHDFYCEEDYIHWDSDVSTDDDVTEREIKILSLSTLALKTLFSNKCLGRVPRKKRKVKTEKSVFDSILNTDFDISKDIDNIIDNLGDDDNTDGINDTILKDGENEESVNVNNDEQTNIDTPLDDRNSETNLVQIKEPESKNVSDDKVNIEEIEKPDEVSESREKIEESNNEYVSEDDKNCLTEESKVISEKNEDLEANDEKVSKITNDSNDVVENKNDGIETLHTQDKVTVDGNEINSKEDSKVSKNVDSASESLSHKDNISEETSISVSRDKMEANENKCDISKITENNQDINGIDLRNTDKENISYVHTVEASNTQISDSENVQATEHTEVYNKRNFEKTKEEIEQQQPSDQSSESSDKVKANEDTVNNSDVSGDNTIDVKSNKVTEELTYNENHKTNVDFTEDNITINGEVEEKSDKLNMDEFNDVCDSEIDDKKLMDDLNEHIGEVDEKSMIGDGVNMDNENNDDIESGCKIDDTNDNGKITLDDLIPKKNIETHSMDLDNISEEEFNFDS